MVEAHHRAFEYPSLQSDHAEGLFAGCQQEHVRRCEIRQGFVCDPRDVYAVRQTEAVHFVAKAHVFFAFRRPTDPEQSETPLDPLGKPSADLQEQVGAFAPV